MKHNIKLDTNVNNLIKGMTAGGQSTLTELREVDTEYNGIFTPKLLVALMNPSASFRKTRSFIYDEVTDNQHLPNGKSYTEKGDASQKGTYKQHTFAIPSYGTTYGIQCEDYADQRKPGTTDQFMDRAYLDEREQRKVMKAFDLLNELNMASLLTTDTPDYRDGGVVAPPNFYTELIGTARGANVAVPFNTITSLGEYRDITEEVVDETEEKAQIRGRSVSRYVMVCGKNYFNGVRELEAQENLAREIRGMDLAQEGLPTLSDGEFGNIRFLDGSDGILYVKYTASILGSRMIGDNDAYLLPVGVENSFVIEYAPASTLDTINKTADAMYMWSEETRREATFEFESNRLYMSKTPELITRFTGTFS